MRPGRKVRFARLMDRPVRDLGGPAVRAAAAGNLSLLWSPRRVVPARPAVMRRCGVWLQSPYPACIVDSAQVPR